MRGLWGGIWQGRVWVEGDAGHPEGEELVGDIATPTYEHATPTLCGPVSQTLHQNSLCSHVLTPKELDATRQIHLFVFVGCA